ncbi:hypothetical protein DH86_00004039 [Scytalidium sp. 3C]|nr:hypothetical protein DH86_00004039 [Scytalidium sp. 3C]
MVSTRVLKDMQAIGRKSGLVSFEIVQGVVLADEEWTPQNNLTTPTSKINRRALFERYKKDIELAYST